MPAAAPERLTKAAVIAELKAAGSPQTAKIYRRHGSGDDVFGVSYAALKVLAKRIKRDQRLAEALWTTGNADARNLALMIADPDVISRTTLDAWITSVTYYAHAEQTASLVAGKRADRTAIAKQWSASKHDFTAEAGWTLYALIAMDARDAADDAFFESLLARIEKQIAKAQNRTRYGMNNALIAIGGRNEHLRELAVAVAGRIGVVVVDHGETGCKTPDAATYIAKSAARSPKKRAG